MNLPNGGRNLRPFGLNRGKRVWLTQGGYAPEPDFSAAALTACGLFAHKETRTLRKPSWRFSQRVVDILLNASSGLAEAMYFRFRDDDIVIATYVKSGIARVW